MKNEFSGLSNCEVERLIAEGKSNRYEAQSRKSLLLIIRNNSLNIFNFINAAVITVLYYFYFDTRDIRLIWDSLGLFGIVVINTFFAVYQEWKATRELEKIDFLLNPLAVVIRNGKEESIPQTDIVLGDIVLLGQGDQAVVDGTILKASRLEMDESLITGESLPVKKKEGASIISGTFCLYGSCIYRAEKVGSQSYAAKVKDSARSIIFQTSPLQKKINYLFTCSFSLMLLLIFIEIILVSGNSVFMVSDIRKISTIAISLIPEGLVFFATVSFMTGIYRIAQKGVIVRKINALDAFASIDTVCLDKTGTLTLNKLQAKNIIPISEASDSTYINKLIATFAYYICDRNATIEALYVDNAFSDTVLLDELPFSGEYKFSAATLKINGSVTTLLLGASDIIQKNLPAEYSEKIEQIITERKLYGGRNLLLCSIEEYQEELLHPSMLISGKLEPLALISLVDEVRPDVYEALQLFGEQKIAVKILSGDSPAAVFTVLQSLNISVNDNVILTGENIRSLEPSEFDKIIAKHSFFARLTPEDKQLIIESLKRQNRRVAMIGDGVNDLPAMRKADLSIAMEHGSAITRESSDMVLRNNDLTTLPGIFNEGVSIINSVFILSKLYLSKSAFVVLLIITAWFSIYQFPLSPRTTSLVSVLGIILPFYIILVKQRSTEKPKHFMKDIFSFVGITSITFMLFYSIYYSLLPSITSLPMLESGVPLIAALFIFNFPNTIKKQSGKGFPVFYITSIVLMLLYMMLTIFDLNEFPLSLIYNFYELSQIEAREWLPILLLGLYSSLVIKITEKVRGHKKSPSLK